LISPLFSDDGSRLLFPSSDGLVRTFDVATGQEIGEGFGSLDKKAARVASGVGGQVFYVSIFDSTTTVWEMNPAGWAARACQAAGRNLTQAEWDRFLPSAGPRRTTCETWPP
jgi:WD40 repeat protein